ncbi:PilZ domain-containing protein [Ciceribacter sp. L1K23]|uniref:PilZ domain-containing protein n=1 Tax=Ciceribacter sp. L1K23 TaxID=2820276 RepID=UPI001B83D4BB|nr:PilZ domain-containing protein [Ciceribacter sp. L1K23]MBR0555845.1 PilZ domain-containing protein [Ciceribacter sp. L1K23]
MQPMLKIDGRKTPRSRVRIDSTVRHLNQEVDARVLDISRAGLSLEFYGRLHAAHGSTVQINNDRFGLIEGTVRWCRNGRLGVQLRENSNTLAKMSAYFRNFHREVRPVLSR